MIALMALFILFGNVTVLFPAHESSPKKLIEEDTGKTLEFDWEVQPYHPREGSSDFL